MPGFPSSIGSFAYKQGSTQTALLKGSLMEDESDILILPGGNIWMGGKGKFVNIVFP